VQLGLAAGAEIDLLAYLVGRYFPIQHYGAIYEATLAVFSLDRDVPETWALPRPQSHKVLSCKARQNFQRLTLANHLGIFGVKVKQAGLMGPGVPIGASLADNQRDKAML